MSDLQRERSGFRFAETRFGDTLQAIAGRELGDAARWTDLITYNDLLPPFVTDDAALAGNGVLLSGELILVPAPSPASTETSEAADVFGTDLKLSAAGDLITDGVDFTLCSGVENLVQALGCRILTERGELIFHPEYGCDVRRLLGKVVGPTRSLVAANVVRGAVNDDDRVSVVQSATAEVAGDALRIEVIAETIAGQRVSLTQNL